MTIHQTGTTGPTPASSTPLFPDGPVPRRRRGRVLVALVVAALLAAAGAGIAGADRTVELRTATAGVHDVAATLHGVVTLEPVVQAAVAFVSDGTVASVAVAVGDEVGVGRQLASLDPDDLTGSLHAAEAELAEAELDLRRALDGEDVGEDGGSSSGGAAAEPVSTISTTGDGAATESVVLLAVDDTSSASDHLASLQQAVLDAQQAVDAALAASEAALAAADEVCETGTVADTTSTTSTTTAATEVAETEACRTALGEVLTAQQAAAATQSRLASAASALDEHLLSLDGSSTDDGGADGGAAGGAAAPSTGAGSTTGADTTTSSPSAAELIALQQRVDAAALGVAVAQQALDRASIVAPIDGTVVAVAIEAGDEVTAGSSTQTITIQGDGGMEAVTTVALSEVSDVAVGQRATVVPDGSHDELTGEVVAVASVPDEDASATSFRVTIGFPDGADEVGNGTTGSVTIVTDDVRSALAVPTSAVTWADGRAMVQMRDGDSTESVVVQLGVVGAEWAEVLSGVDDGDVVVLADPDEPLPGTATDVTSGGAGGGLPAGVELPQDGAAPGGGGGPSGAGPPTGN